MTATPLDRSKPLTLHALAMEAVAESLEAEVKAKHLRMDAGNEHRAPAWSIAISKAAGITERTGRDETTVDGGPRINR